MNTTATISSDHSWSRRCSTETVFSIQGKETDIARDTSDTEAADSDATDASDVEYEPVTESDDDGPLDDDDTSANSDNDIIVTKVVEMSVGDDGELQFADSERTDSHESDSELDLYDYWNCAQCRAKNNNPLYRFCQKCYKVRKNFFPPRPKPKRNILTKTDEIQIPRTLSQDFGVESQTSQETDVLASQDVFAASQDLTTQELQLTSQEVDPILGEGTSNPKPSISVNSYRKRRAESTDEIQIPRTLSQDSGVESQTSQETDVLASQDVFAASQDLTTRDLQQTSQEVDPILGEGSSNPKPSISVNSYRKRRAESADRRTKRKRAGTDSDTVLDSDDDLFDPKPKIDVKTLVKTVSDPAITIEKPPLITKKVIANTLIEKMEEKDLCMVCISEPKTGVFVHGRIAHICCCYKCAVKVWAKAKRCPVCNCKVSNVLRAVVM